MFGRKQKRIEQLEREAWDLKAEIAVVQERLRRSLGHEEELRTLVSKQAKELLALETSVVWVQKPVITKLPAKKKKKSTRA